ncbi:Retrotran gag 3 domain-containing protein [Abeliophyllum distichum]|uniref:Retrotran gag 3 domain-containing protein n=1 Tax=Abeliophyllum distichum TaxID=126358 RepID=A0ABD1V874_9LAMI
MDFQQEEYVLQFLMGLNESYSQARAQILMLDPLPPINKVFSLIIQEERQRSLSPYMTSPMASSSNSHSHAFGISTNTYKGKQSKPICTHCGKLGHTINDCYKLHGFPPGYKFKSNRSGQNNLHPKPIINQVGTAGIENSTTLSPCTDPLQNKCAVSALSPSQCQQIIALPELSTSGNKHHR